MQVNQILWDREKTNYKRGRTFLFFSILGGRGSLAGHGQGLGPRRPVVDALLKVLVMTSHYKKSLEQMEQGAEPI